MMAGGGGLGFKAYDALNTRNDKELMNSL